MMVLRLKAMLLAATTSLAGCGLYVPDHVIDSQPNAESFFVNRVVNHVKCELRAAIIGAIDYDIANAKEQPDRLRRIPWLERWGAKVTIKLIADEKGSLNPSVTLNPPLFNSDVFSLGLGGTLSAQATRTDTIDYYFHFGDDFLSQVHRYPNRPAECIQQGGVLVESDLKLKEWIRAATFPFFIPDNVNAKPPDVFSHQVAFIVVANASVTPTLKLVRVSATGSPFAFGGRIRTSDLIVTMGPAAPGKFKIPSRSVEDSHSAMLVQSALSAAIRSQQ